MSTTLVCCALLFLFCRFFAPLLLLALPFLGLCRLFTAYSECTSEDIPIVPYGNRPVNFQILAAAHLQSKAGNTFYLVIDYDKLIDEEAEMYETYFLNLVDERDLLALMSDEEKEEVPTPTPEIIYVAPEPTAVPAPTPVVTEPEPEKKLDQMTAIIALATIVLLGGGGAIFMLKNNNIGKRQM